MNQSTFDLNILSPHLFWDLDKRSITFKDHKQFIVKRILEYGLYTDWTALNQYLDIDEIADIVTEIKDLDPKSLAFISAISNRPKEKFICYTMPRSTTPHWNF
jgi:hypothetical protein